MPKWVLSLLLQAFTFLCLLGFPFLFSLIFGHLGSRFDLNFELCHLALSCLTGDYFNSLLYSISNHMAKKSV